jgi:hypothetical protein
MPSETDYQISDDQIHASAIRFLIGGGEEDAASVLISCSLHSSWWQDFGIDYKNFSLTGPRAAYDILSVRDHPIRKAIVKAIGAVLPVGIEMGNLIARGELLDIDPGWRSEMLEIVRGEGVSNQAAIERSVKIQNWHNFGFRSTSEVKIAEALDKAGVLFLPNCKARLGVEKNRENREPDFLVCHKGKWGILEVDGEPFHPPSRTVADHERDRLFKMHGIIVTEHYDATKCFEKPDEVVNQFLKILDR